MASYEKHEEGDYYLREHAIPSFQLERGPVRAVLQAIAATDRVWERPTNLFSHFYGLPDSREALRRLAEELLENH